MYCCGSALLLSVARLAGYAMRCIQAHAQSPIAVCLMKSLLESIKPAGLMWQVPEGVDPVVLTTNAMDKFNVEIAGGLGGTVGKVFRVSSYSVSMCLLDRQ